MLLSGVVENELYNVTFLAHSDQLAQLPRMDQRLVPELDQHVVFLQTGFGGWTLRSDIRRD